MKLYRTVVCGILYTVALGLGSESWLTTSHAIAGSRSGAALCFQTGRGVAEAEPVPRGGSSASTRESQMP